PNDVVAIINYLNGFGASDVPASAVSGSPFGFLDTHADDIIAPNDVVDVIEHLNAFGAGEGEGGQGSGVGSQGSGVSGQGSSVPSDVLALLAADASMEATRRRK